MMPQAALGGVFLAVFGVLCRMACPTVSFDDTGEFCAGALELGVLHPPGYPGYTLLMALASAIPAGSMAFRMNLVAVVGGGCAAVLLLAWWRRVHQWDGSATMLAGAAVAMAAVSSFGFLSQGTTAKGGVYTWNACLMVGLLLPLLASRQGSREAALAGGGAGLFLAHHWMSAAGSLAGLLLSLAARGVAPTGRRVAVAAAGATLGLSLFLYLPLATVHRPFLNWGSPDRSSRAWFSVARSQYTGQLADEEEREPLGRRLASLRDAARGTAPVLPLVLLAAAGAGALAARRRLAAAATVAAPLGLLMSLLAYGPIRAGAPWYLEIFAVPAFAVITALAGSGLLALLTGAWHAVRRADSGRAVRGPAWGTAGLVVLLLAARAGPRITALDRSREYLTWDLAANLMWNAPGPGMLFANSDAIVFGNWHAWRVEKRLKGPVVIPAPLLPMPWVAEGFAAKLQGLRAPYPSGHTGAEAVPALMRAWQEGNADRLPAFTFLSEPARRAWPAKPARGAARAGRRVPHGWYERIEPRPAPSAARAARPPLVRGFRWRGILGAGLDLEPRRRGTLQPLWFSGALSLASWLGVEPGRGREAAAVLRLADGLARSPADRAAVCEERGGVAARDRRFAVAARWFAQAARLAPPRPGALRNLALVLLGSGRKAEAARALKTLMEQAPDSPEAREMRPMMASLEPRVGLGR